MNVYDEYVKQRGGDEGAEAPNGTENTQPSTEDAAEEKA